MEKTIENIKSFIPIAAVIVALAGFYYTTQHRLDHLEQKIEELEVQDKKIKKSIPRKKNESE